MVRKPSSAGTPAVLAVDRWWHEREWNQELAKAAVLLEQIDYILRDWLWEQIDRDSMGQRGVYPAYRSLFCPRSCLGLRHDLDDSDFGAGAEAYAGHLATLHADASVHVERCSLHLKKTRLKAFAVFGMGDKGAI